MKERRGVFSLLRRVGRSSLRSKRSVITPLWIHSGFSIPAHGKTVLCSLHLNVIRDNWGEKKHVAHCCCYAGTPKIIPASAVASHWQHSNAARIIHSRVLSREHRAELEFQRGIVAINNNYTHSRRFRQNVSHFLVLLSLESSLMRSHFLCAHRSRSGEWQLLIIIRGVCKCDILI